MYEWIEKNENAGVIFIDLFSKIRPKKDKRNGGNIYTDDYEASSETTEDGNGEEHLHRAAVPSAQGGVG